MMDDRNDHHNSPAVDAPATGVASAAADLRGLSRAEVERLVADLDAAVRIGRTLETLLENLERSRASLLESFRVAEDLRRRGMKARARQTLETVRQALAAAAADPWEPIKDWPDVARWRSRLGGH